MRMMVGRNHPWVCCQAPKLPPLPQVLRKGSTESESNWTMYLFHPVSLLICQLRSCEILWDKKLRPGLIQVPGKPGNLPIWHKYFSYVYCFILYIFSNFIVLFFTLFYIRPVNLVICRCEAANSENFFVFMFLFNFFFVAAKFPTFSFYVFLLFDFFYFICPVNRLICRCEAANSA